MIDEVVIDWDDGGAYLRLVGDLEGDLTADRAGLTARLSQDAVIQLAAQSREKLDPWVAEMERNRFDYGRATEEERRTVTGLVDRDDRDDPDEALRVGGDLARKAAREGARS